MNQHENPFPLEKFGCADGWAASHHPICCAVWSSSWRLKQGLYKSHSSHLLWTWYSCMVPAVEWIVYHLSHFSEGFSKCFINISFADHRITISSGTLTFGLATRPQAVGPVQLQEESALIIDRNWAEQNRIGIPNWWTLQASQICYILVSMIFHRNAFGPFLRQYFQYI